MKKKQIYETEDGRTFENRQEALKHEAGIKYEASLKAFIIKSCKEVKASEVGADMTAMDVLYEVASVQAGGEAHVEKGDLAKVLIEILRENPADAAAAIKGTFSTRAPRKRAAKKAAKKNAAKKTATKPETEDKAETAAPAAEKKETPPPAPPAKETPPPAPSAGNDTPPPPPPPPAG